MEERDRELPRVAEPLPPGQDPEADEGQRRGQRERRRQEEGGGQGGRNQ